ncbi:MAG TPA: ABC-type transport auxiliary lipoprotein family protein, partial [Rhizomicrobium sp.]|nr:ABC-type transport auxiliary lipoprotein family protein [Rhizomicrobium sp.]
MTDASQLSRRLVLLAVPTVTLAACGSLHLLEPSNAPGKIYVLVPNLPQIAGLPHSASQIAVATPEASASFATSRIAIRRQEEFDYYADAQWTDGVPQLLQTLFVEALEKNGAAAASDVAGIRADYTVQSEVRAFEARYAQADAAPTVVVDVAVRLVAARSSGIVASREFHEEQPAAANSIPAAVAAFDQAVSALLADVVGWVLET